MGELFKYNEIAKLASEIFMDSNENISWVTALEIAHKKYEEGEQDGIQLDGSNFIYSKE